MDLEDVLWRIEGGVLLESLLMIDEQNDDTNDIPDHPNTSGKCWRWRGSSSEWLFQQKTLYVPWELTKPKGLDIK